MHYFSVLVIKYVSKETNFAFCILQLYLIIPQERLSVLTNVYYWKDQPHPCSSEHVSCYGQRPQLQLQLINTIHHVSNHLPSIPGPIQGLPWFRKAAVPNTWSILQTGGKTWRKFIYIPDWKSWKFSWKKEKSQRLQEGSEKKETSWKGDAYSWYPRSKFCSSWRPYKSIERNNPSILSSM